MSRKPEVGIASLNTDSAVVLTDYPHPKCPSCGQVFERLFLLPWEDQGCYPMCLEETNGTETLVPLDEIECGCGYVLHCEHEPPAPPHWWGQEGRDTPRHGLLPEEYIDLPRRCELRFTFRVIEVEQHKGPQAVPGLRYRLSPKGLRR